MAKFSYLTASNLIKPQKVLSSSDLINLLNIVKSDQIKYQVLTNKTTIEPIKFKLIPYQML